MNLVFSLQFLAETVRMHKFLFGCQAILFMCSCLYAWLHIYCICAAQWWDMITWMSVWYVCLLTRLLCMSSGCFEEAGSRLSRQHRGSWPPAADQTTSSWLFPAVFQHGGELCMIPCTPNHREWRTLIVSTKPRVFWRSVSVSWLQLCLSLNFSFS